MRGILESWAQRYEQNVNLWNGGEVPGYQPEICVAVDFPGGGNVLSAIMQL